MSAQDNSHASLQAQVEKLEADNAALRQSIDTRLETARQAARYAAWADMMSAFTQEEREHVARLLAHKWWISGINMRQTEDGRDYTHAVQAATLSASRGGK